MKTLIHYLTLALALVAGFNFSLHAALAPATPAPDEENLQAMLDLMRSDANPFKIRTLNQVMALTGPEAEKFWPVYQQYEKDLAAITRKATTFIRDFLELQASGRPEDKRWNDLAKKWLSLKEEQIALWGKYQKKISKEVSAYRAAQFLQVEHQMALFTDLSIASEMPVIGRMPLSDSQKPTMSLPMTEKPVLVRITATVEAIDYDKREATLKGPLGNSVTVTVDERVKRLREIKVGDTVTADYYVSVAAEIRPPTAEEKKEPLVILEGVGKAPAGTSPAGGGLRQIKAVCTIEGLDRPTETVTLKGPLGRYVGVRTSDPANLPQLRIGDTVLVTYTEALAIAVEELANPSAKAR